MALPGALVLAVTLPVRHRLVDVASSPVHGRSSLVVAGRAEGARQPAKLLVQMAGKGESFYGRFAPGAQRAAA